MKTPEEQIAERFAPEDRADHPDNAGYYFEHPPEHYRPKIQFLSLDGISKRHPKKNKRKQKQRAR